MSGNCERTIHDHTLQLNCSQYLPVDETQIPTGERACVSGTGGECGVFDFLAEKPLGGVIPLIDGGGKPGLDHCFVVNTNDEHGTVKEGSLPTLAMQEVAVLTDIAAKRRLTIRSTQPAVQVYTANWLPEDDTSIHRQYNAVALECQHFPNAVNDPVCLADPKLSTLLSPHQTYQHETQLIFGVL